MILNKESFKFRFHLNNFVGDRYFPHSPLHKISVHFKIYVTEFKFGSQDV